MIKTAKSRQHLKKITGIFSAEEWSIRNVISINCENELKDKLKWKWNKETQNVIAEVGEYHKQLVK